MLRKMEPEIICAIGAVLGFALFMFLVELWR